MSGVPVLRCGEYPFERITADPRADPWPGITPVNFFKTENSQLPLQATRFRVGRDAENLRLLFDCEDAEPWATLTGHDEPLYTEEVVEAFLDPVGDGEAYFELEVNVNNAVLDGCMRRVRSGYRKDFGWHCEGLRTAVQLTESGWVSEWVIPFRSLVPSPPRAGDYWRVNFTRIDRPTGAPRELSAWSPTGLAQFHVPSKFGVLEF